MKKLGLLILGAVLGASLAFAQSVVQNQISGNEVWRAAQGPGGPESYISVQSVRNSSAMTRVSGAGAATTAMTTAQSTLMWVGTAPTTWAVTLPLAPVDGTIVNISTDTTLTTMVTVTAASGDTLNATYASQTLTAVTAVQFQYSAGNRTWYRFR